MKYKLTNNTKKVNEVTLYQIEALRSFSNVKKGQLGGYIQNEKNLLQSGDAWVSGDAMVSGNARVSSDARVYGDAVVSGGARVSGGAWVFTEVSTTPTTIRYNG